MNSAQPQQSTSKVSSTIQSEDTEVTKISGSKGAIMGKKLRFQPHWQKKYSKMKAHEASEWHKLAKAKVEAKKHSQAEGSVILQLKHGKERCDEQTKQQYRILINHILFM